MKLGLEVFDKAMFAIYLANLQSIFERNKQAQKKNLLGK